MRVYEIKRKDGQVFAIEVDNVYIRPAKIAKLLVAIDGVSNVRLRKPFSSPNEIHVAFKYMGEDFIVWEPYGDSSRYWVGPKFEEKCVDIRALVKAIEKYDPPLLKKIIGDLITFNIGSLFRRS